MSDVRGWDGIDSAKDERLLAVVGCLPGFDPCRWVRREHPGVRHAEGEIASQSQRQSGRQRQVVSRMPVCRSRSHASAGYKYTARGTSGRRHGASAPRRPSFRGLQTCMLCVRCVDFFRGGRGRRRKGGWERHVAGLVHVRAGVFLQSPVPGAHCATAFPLVSVTNQQT